MKRQRVDDGASTANVTIRSHLNASERTSRPPRTQSKWDTPLRAPGSTPLGTRRNRWDLTPAHEPQSASGSETPLRLNGSGLGAGGETPMTNRWVAQTPSRVSPNASPKSYASRFGATPSNHSQSKWGQKPDLIGDKDQISTASNPLLANIASSASQNWQRDTLLRNRPLTNEELDRILPTEGYEIVKAPDGYKPTRTQPENLDGSASIQQTPDGYQIPDGTSRPYDPQAIPGGDSESLPFIKPEDVSYFSALLNEVDEEGLSGEDLRERRIMMLLLKVKNGTPPMRKTALKTLTEKAREFGAGPLFKQILPLLMSPTLEDQERHLLVKVIDRILYKLDDLVRPYVHKILVVIEPLLIDEDFYARVEGREIISNLAKAAGLATMIATMRPDIDHNDEYVRNTTARAFAVISSALGIPAILPFLKAVCRSKKSWRARHTGVKIVQQIAILMGCAVLPHLKKLVDTIEHGLKDEEQKVRTITALALSALAEASNPYGIEAFHAVLIPLWDGISMYRGKALAAFLKAIGYIIPLMDSDHAGEYTKFVTPVLIREFQNPDDEMKKIVLKVVKQCVATDGVQVSYIRDEIVPSFFSNFWIRRNAVDKKNYK